MKITHTTPEGTMNFETDDPNKIQKVLSLFIGGITPTHIEVYGVPTKKHKAKNKPANSSSAWEEEDTLLLEKLCAEGKSYTAMARQLHRTKNAIRNRVCTLKLKKNLKYTDSQTGEDTRQVGLPLGEIHKAENFPLLDART